MSLLKAGSPGGSLKQWVEHNVQQGYSQTSNSPQRIKPSCPHQGSVIDTERFGILPAEDTALERVATALSPEALRNRPSPGSALSSGSPRSPTALLPVAVPTLHANSTPGELFEAYEAAHASVHSASAARERGGLNAEDGYSPQTAAEPGPMAGEAGEDNHGLEGGQANADERSEAGLAHGDTEWNRRQVTEPCHTPVDTRDVPIQRLAMILRPIPQRAGCSSMSSGRA